MIPTPVQPRLRSSEKLKLLHIIASVDPAGGGPIESLLRQNEACGGWEGPVQREIATLDYPGSPHLAGVPMPVHALGAPRSGSPLPGVLGRYGYSPRLVPWLRENVCRFDAVLVEGLWNYSTFAAARVLPGGPTPYFVFVHGMLDPWFRKTYPFKHLGKQVSWWLAEGPLLAGAKAALFTCEEERNLARGAFVGPSYNARVVGIGAASPPPRTRQQAAAFRAAVPQLGDRPYLLFLSRIHPKKGCDLLVDAFAKLAADHPGLDLVVAGPDQTGWTAELASRAAQLGVGDRVHWPGALYGEAKWGAYYGAEAFVLPSHQENFGIVVAEALSCNTPVLITDKVNIWREVEVAGAGLVRKDDLKGVEELLLSWLSMSTQDKAAMRAEARRTFNAHFNVRQTAPRVLELAREAA